MEPTGRGSEPHTHLNVRPVMRCSIDPRREVRLSLPVHTQEGQRSGSRTEMHSGSSGWPEDVYLSPRRINNSGATSARCDAETGSRSID